MPDKSNIISLRKKEHIELSLTDKVSFKEKNNGFENFDFLHYAITEIDLDKIYFKTKFLKKTINFPFLISCMTGGTSEAESINSKLAVAANELNIPLGVGSQRQALENKAYYRTYKTIRDNAPNVPILGNLGASQIVLMKKFDGVKFLASLINANAMVIHVNPLQELMQKNGQPSFSGFLKKIEKLVKYLDIPVIVKEVGAGISKRAAENLLNAGVKGIDVAGAGGTSWSGVEILRAKGDENNRFWDWGIPTSYCIKEVSLLKKKFKFTLIGSGGINDAFDAAKAFALGADLTASARIILQKLDKDGVDGVITLVNDWFNTIKNILFLTGSKSLKDLQKNKLIKKGQFY
jgi:isopentenyl-diphosphate Delta-isomerase